MAQFSKAKLQEELENQLSANADEKPTTRDVAIFGLLDKIDELKNDQAIKEYFRVNNAMISKLVERDEMPNLSQILHTEPDWGKEKALDELYRIFAMCFGEPPKTFDFEYRDKDKNYHIDRSLTAKAFYDKYVGWDLENDFVSVVNSPTQDKPFYQRLHYIHD